jgi:hypothetical protein
MTCDDETRGLIVAAMQARTESVSGDLESLDRLLDRLPRQRRLGRGAIAVAVLSTAVIVTGGIVIGVEEIRGSGSTHTAISSTTTSLESVGPPTVSAVCSSGAYQAATKTSPLTTIAGATIVTGIRLTGAACDTTFTWHLDGRFVVGRATVYLDRADSGPVPFTLRNGRSTLAFQSNGHTVDRVTVGGAPVRLRVDLRGVDSFSIVMPNHGDDGGVLDLAAGRLTR